MHYFIVFQNQTYKQERTGGFLWAPQQNKKGRTFFHWTNMEKVKKGDVIFSSYAGKLVSVNIAKEDCLEHKKPQAFTKIELWEQKGWLVWIDYYEIEEPIDFIEYKESILALQGDKYAPFNRHGGGNQGYLFEIPAELASYLLSLIKSKQEDPTILNRIEELEADSNNQVMIEQEKKIPTELDETEKEQIIQSRVGQGIFRKKLELLDGQCKICKLKNKDLLVASHSKPWRDSNNQERLDEYNGFLLCPGHDALYDKGYISFNRDGKILISNALDAKAQELLNVNDEIMIELLEGHQYYLEYHRKNIFKDSKKN